MVLADVLNNVITYITGGAFLVVIIEESVRAALRKKREKREAEEKKHEENARKIEEQETEAKIKTATDKSLEPVIRALALLTDDVRNNTSNQKDILIQIQAVDKKADKLEDRQSKLIIQVNAVTEDVEKVKESQLATLRNTLNDLFWACTERGYKRDSEIRNFNNMFDQLEKVVSRENNPYIYDIRDRFSKLPSEDKVSNKGKTKTVKKE